ncbi:MFS transporter [Actinoplanes sp. N902-109]|uniref:MFS transporter n=1 Tax=Actinoplanes sp. (strain N902-109) TaxID=649831 RepID=UPI0003294B61|nr:MFS transporter [Actinoplanes sp. N902-109]AGL14958.1 major facilitator transporter [Actinoplanes sp. N902-109]
MSEDRPAARPVTSGGATERASRVGYRDVLAVREFRALYISLIVNWLGDYLARAAIIVLVYEQSQSVTLSAASFAISYLPWVIGGPVLAALAERYPYRRVLILADVVRAVPIALIALPGMPVPAMLVLMFVTMLFAPPTQSARSALIPLILDRRLVVTGLALNSSTSQAAQVFGYLAGGVLAVGVNARLGLVLDSASFLLSGVIIAAWVRPRPAANAPAQRKHLMRETAEGFRLVFGTPQLRSIALMVFALTTFTILPEGLAAGWAALFHDDPAARGFDQGMIMAAGPIGFVIGGLAIGRVASQTRKHRLVPPFAAIAPLALALTVFAPNAGVVAVLVAASGVAQGVLVPTLNGTFVLALPHGYRARAFGVMQSGLQLSQGAAVMVTGVLAGHSSIPMVVGLWCLGGLVLMMTLAPRWGWRNEAGLRPGRHRRPEETEQPGRREQQAPPPGRHAAAGDGPGEPPGPASGPNAGPHAAQAGSLPPQTGPHPPLTGPHPPQVGTRPPQAGSRPPQAGPRPPQAGPRPPQAGPRPPQAGPRPPQAGSRPPQAGPSPAHQEATHVTPGRGRHTTAGRLDG